MNEEDFHRVMGAGVLAGGAPIFADAGAGPAHERARRRAWPAVRETVGRLVAWGRAQAAAGRAARA